MNVEQFVESFRRFLKDNDVPEDRREAMLPLVAKEREFINNNDEVPLVDLALIVNLLMAASSLKSAEPLIENGLFSTAFGVGELKILKNAYNDINATLGRLFGDLPKVEGREHLSLQSRPSVGVDLVIPDALHGDVNLHDAELFLAACFKLYHSNVELRNKMIDSVRGEILDVANAKSPSVH